MFTVVRRRLGSLLLLLLITALALPALPLAAQTATSTGYDTAVAYQNIGSTTATLSFAYYPLRSAAPAQFVRTLAPNAARSVNIGSVSFTGGTTTSAVRGSVVIAATQPLVAVTVQTPELATLRNKALSLGFLPSQATNAAYVPTFLRNTFNRTSLLAIQNADTVPVTLTVSFYARNGNGTARLTRSYPDLPPGASYQYSASNLRVLGAFDGSAIVTATGKIVATVMETATNSAPALSSYEALPQGSTQLALPTMFCRAGGRTTTLALMNTGGDGAATANLTFRFSNGVEAVRTLAPNVKLQVNACNLGLVGNTSAGLLISSDGPPIAAVAKTDGAGHSAAYSAIGSSGTLLAAPLVRWTISRFNTTSSRRYRTQIYVQNAGDTPIAAGNVVIEYYNGYGRLVGVHTLGALAPGATRTSQPRQSTLTAGSRQVQLDEFGYQPVLGGSALIRCIDPSGCRLAAVVRQLGANSSTTQVAEDYSAFIVE
jgi:hypothetical protein